MIVGSTHCLNISTHPHTQKWKATPEILDMSRYGPVFNFPQSFTPRESSKKLLGIRWEGEKKKIVGIQQL